MSVVDRINDTYPELRNAEKIVADYILSNLSRRFDKSITDLAKAVGVSEATISRLSRSLGYSGYQDLKLSIAAGGAYDEVIPNLPAEIRETDQPLEISQKLSDALTNSIRDTRAFLDKQALGLAVDALCASNQIVFMGVGGAASICLEASHLFAKAGRAASYVLDDYGQIVTASTMRAGQTLVAISHTGQTKSVADALQLARKAGARTIAITSDRRSAVATAAETALITWKHEKTSVALFGDFIEGRACQLYLVDLLFILVMFRSEQNEKDNLRLTGNALKDFYFSISS
ncbi:MurR/RpiR family transcriptional regulator [Stagnihabitans tardus]|uniref:SIS domain-containing protein n=1 Tax=Stagnihabitans tardus TaxID=2699202 RepID=A0AAE5BTS9_9RHOB|nr:SIS domain-containing protein [Stagnihabitans tardus]